jgi:hypothetical protein
MQAVVGIVAGALLGTENLGSEAAPRALQIADGRVGTAKGCEGVDAGEQEVQGQQERQPEYTSTTLAERARGASGDGG